MTASVDRRWAVGLCRHLAGLAPRHQVALVANRIAAALDVEPVAPAVPVGEREAAALVEGYPQPPRGWADPWLVGQIHEQAVSPGDRKARGAWYTPRSVVVGLTGVVISPNDLPELVIDPTCGGGAFLLAAVDRFVAVGLDAGEAVGRVKGLDFDAVAVEVTRWSLSLWLAARLGDGSARNHALSVIDVRRGDALQGLPKPWRGRVAVVGNPPFASPLKTGAMPESAVVFRKQRSQLLGPYADLGAVHLLHAIESVGVGSTVALVQPQSVLAGRDTEGLRDWCSERGWLVGLWAARSALFDAGVRPCAPILRLDGPAAPNEASAPNGVSAPNRASAPHGVSASDRVALYHGPEVTLRRLGTSQGWGALAADALGAPALPVLGGQTLGALASATAGFRDEHYALVAACREWDGPDDAVSASPGVGRVITVGSVEPLQVDWGRRAYRFGGVERLRPVVDRTDLPPKVQRWFDRLCRPKVLLATQAKLLEPVIDRDGTAVPATPLIAVTADPADLDRVAAVLLAPPVALWAWRRWFGAALSVDAVKLAARQVGELPLPRDQGAWDHASALVAAADGLDPAAAWAQADEVASAMTRAYGADDEVLAWWRSRAKAQPPAP